MMDIKDLRLVLAIAEHGSLVRAARVLGTSQPTLTRTLSELETRLRGPLFERSRQGVIITDLGRAVLRDAQDLVDRLARLEHYVATVRGDQLQELSVVAGAFAAESICIAAAARMATLYPNLRLRLKSMNWADVPRVVNEREATIGVMDVRGVASDSGLVVEPLRPQPGVFVVRPGHPLAGRATLDLADIMAFPMLMIGRVFEPVQARFAEAREEARSRSRLHPAFPAIVQESPTVALAALRHSDAVACVTLAIASQALRADTLVALPWRAPWVSVHPGIVRLRTRKLQEPELAFIDLLRDSDAQTERETLDWCAAAGMSPACS